MRDRATAGLRTRPRRPAAPGTDAAKARVAPYAAQARRAPGPGTGAGSTARPGGPGLRGARAAQSGAGARVPPPLQTEPHYRPPRRPAHGM
ncbi:hypothetical protein GCM10010393_30560 [Streptomyces gobitricini]|uniref:Uncharacterized protein n=1 Tax=Streptomyces gobitricini TaxID=68211 RepID=A0ABN3M6I3_9ACTN